MSSLSAAERADLQALAASALPDVDPQLVEYLMELSALGCQAKDVKDFLRCLVARPSAGAAAGAVRLSK
eukprot:199091-Chlamydomonas_euryale.AAC.7